MKLSNESLSALKMQKDLVLNAWAKKSYQDQGKKRVMIIDDCPKTTELIKILLKDEIKLNSEIYNDEFEALRSILTNEPDLLLLDVHLSTVNGIRLKTFIDSISFYQIPVVYMSAASKSSFMKENFFKNNELFLQKPFQKNHLVDLLKQGLTAPKMQKFAA